MHPGVPGGLLPPKMGHLVPEESSLWNALCASVRAIQYRAFMVGAEERQSCVVLCTGVGQGVDLKQGVPCPMTQLSALSVGGLATSASQAAGTVEVRGLERPQHNQAKT